MSGLWRDFLTNRGRPVHKWTHYFPIYERHFSMYVNRPVSFWEIGVGGGGSLQLWKRFLGPYAQIVGLDVVDKRDVEEDQVAVRVGDQADAAFLQRVLEEFGPPDVVLDDGSHVMDHIRASFRYLYPRMSASGVYMVEDLHTSYWQDFGGGLGAPGSFIEDCKGLIDELSAETTDGAVAPTEFSAMTLSMHFYDSAVVFERGRHLRKHAPSIGGTPDASATSPDRSQVRSPTRPRGLLRRSAYALGMGFGAIVRRAGAGGRALGE